MPHNSRFQYTVAIETGHSATVFDLARMMAKAMHPYEEASFAHSFEAIRKQLGAAIDSGELQVRRPVGATDAGEPDLFHCSVVDAEHLCSFLGDRGFGVQFTPHGRGPEYWTIRHAAMDIAAQLGLHDEATEPLMQQLLDAVEAGELSARDPITLARATGTNVLECWELVRVKDVNRWLQQGEALHAWHPVREREGPLGAQTAVTPFDLSGQAIDAPSPVLPGRAKGHSTRTSRRDALSPVIEQARASCRDPSDAAEVWAKLSVMAERREPPLLGATDEGLQYLRHGDACILSRDALAKRIKRTVQTRR